MRKRLGSWGVHTDQTKEIVGEEKSEFVDKWTPATNAKPN